MVAEMLSQEEINALLGNMDTVSDDSASDEKSQQSEDRVILSDEETDALGEIGNICMGTAATTLFTLLNHKVMITTPKVESLTWDEFVGTITDDLIAVSVDYTEGFLGSNLMILKDHDVKIIADLMMGGTGAYTEGPVTELHLSAIAESMNQMIGSSSTSMAQIFNKKIDISPPQAIKMDTDLEEIFGPKGGIVKISFRLQIEENIIDSELMQVLPVNFAKELINGLLADEQSSDVIEESSNIQESNVHTEQEVVQEVQPNVNISQEERTFSEPVVAQNIQPSIQPTMQPSMQQNMQPVYEQQHVNMPTGPAYYGEQPNMSYARNDVDIQKPKFEAFDTKKKAYPKENIDLLMDVSLEVAVELGRTSKKIKEILEFGPGSIIELNCLVGEPVDVLVNGKFVAKGEVVVIDENFGIRVTDIINPEDRI